MSRIVSAFLFFGYIFLVFSCQNEKTPLSFGLTMNASGRYIPGEYQLSGQSGKSALLLQAEDFFWDAEGSKIIGSFPTTLPDEQEGIGLKIQDGENITLRNLEIMGYETGILAQNVKRLTLENCTIHYQKRQLDTLLPNIAGIILENLLRGANQKLPDFLQPTRSFA